MKKLIILSFMVFMALTACTTGPLKDIRIGKNYGVLFPKKVVVHTAPSPKSRVFKLDVSEAFLVEDVMCADGKSLWSCYSDLVISKDHPEYAQVAFYKVKFESGKEGYINAGYFYPKLSNSLVSEDIAAVGNETPAEYMARVRQGREDIRVEGKARFERQKQLLIELDRLRLKGIATSPWSDADKEMVLKHRVRIGMTKNQLLLSKGRAIKITKSVTVEGEFENWYYKGTTYYFKDNKLIKWETTVSDLSKKIGKSKRGR
jgi:hypothetical protein